MLFFNITFSSSKVVIHILSYLVPLVVEYLYYDGLIFSASLAYEIDGDGDDHLHSIYELILV